MPLIETGHEARGLQVLQIVCPVALECLTRNSEPMCRQFAFSNAAKQNDKLLMRTIINLTVLLLLATSVFAHQDRIEHAQTLTVSFKTGERATFIISNSVLTAITLHIGSVDYAVPAAECTKLRDVRFESVALLWNGSYKSAAEADYFYLRFDMGAESARAFGELPRVQLMFHDRKFEKTSVTNKTAQDTWQDAKL